MGRYNRYDRAFKSAFAEFDKEGPAIDVSPFAPGEATTGAGILRAITAVAGARRARANWEVGQRERQASMYKDALQTQLLEKQLGAPDYEQQRIDETKRYNTERLGLLRNPPAKPKSATERAASAAIVNSAIAGLDKEGERYADEAMGSVRTTPGGGKVKSIAALGQEYARRLLTSEPAEQLKYARALGVQPKLDEVDEVKGEGRDAIIVGKKGRPMKGEGGRYVFDSKDVSNAVAAWMQTRRAGLLNQWKSDNAPRYSAYAKAVQDLAFPGLEVPGDPMEAAALELFGD